MIDTAGIRNAIDEAEEIGIRKSYEALADADLVLLVTDHTSAENRVQELRLFDLTSGRKRILVRNKIDLQDPTTHPPLSYDSVPQVSTSAISGSGIEELRKKIVLEIGGASQPERGFLTNLRQRKLIEESMCALEPAQQAVHNRIPHEMLLMDLYSSLRPLDSITGETTTDDILSLIFSSFCIGK
jgi:tRNA modification GTPase